MALRVTDIEMVLAAEEKIIGIAHFAKPATADGSGAWIDRLHLGRPTVGHKQAAAAPNFADRLAAGVAEDDPHVIG